MILALIAAAAVVTTPVVSAEERRFAECVTLIEKEPAKAIDFAGKWRIEGNSILSRQCLGLAYAAVDRWEPAMTAFEQAAEQAEKDRDGRAGNLWVQTGNAALAGGNPARAKAAFDAALASGTIKGTEAGEVHLDRARALVSLRDVAGARKDIDEALKLVPTDSLGWLLSATLARRTGDLARAQTDIAQAAELGPDDPAIALEAGNIAMLAGIPDAARTAWEGAVALSPDGPEGLAAAKALEQFKAAPTP